MKREYFLSIAEKIIEGRSPDSGIYRELARVPDMDVMKMLPGADLLREHYFGKSIHLCTISNGKSGRCSEDCRFCAQSAHYKTDASVYPLMAGETLAATGIALSDTPVNRYSIVTTGKRLPASEVALVSQALDRVRAAGIHTCASLGIIGEDDLKVLKTAGVDRYHHNLETAESHFSRVCSTHGFEDRVETIRSARRLGFSVCAGGIFGIGETDDQALELAVTLKDLAVDAVPINFLVPIPGTPFEGRPRLSPLRCLKIVALFRYVLPQTEIIICGGREANLKELHPQVFFAGASGIMTGNYLTAEGRSLENDLATIDRLGFAVRKRAPEPGPGHPFLSAVNPGVGVGL